jgi:hypothetical protein
MAPVVGGVVGEELRATAAAAAGVSRGFVSLVGAVSVWFVGKKRFVLCCVGRERKTEGGPLLRL